MAQPSPRGDARNCDRVTDTRSVLPQRRDDGATGMPGAFNRLPRTAGPAGRPADPGQYTTDATHGGVELSRIGGERDRRNTGTPFPAGVMVLPAIPGCLFGIPSVGAATSTPCTAGRHRAGTVMPSGQAHRIAHHDGRHSMHAHPGGGR
jgi:hypothetical protein